MATSDTSKTGTTPFPTSETIGTASATPIDRAIDKATAAASSLPPPSEMLNRVVQGAHETIDRLAETAAPKVQRLQQSVAGANDKLHESADKVRQTSDEWTETLRCTVRENPLAAVATALAIGVLIAKLTR